MVVDNANFLYLGGHNQLTNTKFSKPNTKLSKCIDERSQFSTHVWRRWWPFAASVRLQWHDKKAFERVGLGNGNACRRMVDRFEECPENIEMVLFPSSGHTPGSRATHRCCDNAASERRRQHKGKSPPPHRLSAVSLKSRLQNFGNGSGELCVIKWGAMPPLT